MIPFLRSEIEGTIGARFETVARHAPDAVAIASGDKTWTYGDVLDQSEQYRKNFSRLGTVAPVALVFSHGVEAIIAMMGAIRAGVPVIPLDPQAPPEDVASSVSICQLVVCEPEFEDWCHAHVGPLPVVAGQEGLEEFDQLGPEGTVAAPTPDCPCIIFLTSGTTGAAKRPFRTHRALSRHIWQLPTYHEYGPTDRQAHISSFAFGGSVPVILGGLLTGGAIDVFDLRRTNASALAGAMSARGVTILQLTPSLMRELTDILAQNPTHWQPRLIVVGGEKLYAQDLLALRDRLGWTCPVVHRLASSEAGVIAEWRVDLNVIDADAMVPVGYPVQDREITIVDENGQDLSHGEKGEIVIRGDYLANGYWGRTDLTQEKFSADPMPECLTRQRFATGDIGYFQPNGLLNYLGRKDSMVKIRGYRVELGAIENVMRAINGVTNATVLVKKNRRNTDILLAYAQRAQDVDLNAFTVRTKLQKQLPDYMVPRRIIVMDEFPLTAGGKVAVQKLPNLGRDRPEGMPTMIPPQGRIEGVLAEIWADVLEIDEISRDDDFFDLGGDSLEALQVAMMLQKRTGEAFEETDIFFASDLKGMAEIVAKCSALQIQSIKNNH
jgi:non-ribosomal peptide synthetase component F/acyl carrier protein